MVPYQINLAQGAVIPLEVRRRWHRWLLLYLLVGAVAVGWTVYAVIGEAMELNNRRDMVEKQENNYRKARALQGMDRHWEALVGRADVALREIEAMRTCQMCLEKRVSSVLLGLMNTLPPGAELAGVELDKESRMLRFDIATPAGKEGQVNSTPAQWISGWEKDPVLGARLRQISAEISERSRIGNTAVMLWRFTAELD